MMCQLSPVACVGSDPSQVSIVVGGKFIECFMTIVSYYGVVCLIVLRVWLYLLLEKQGTSF